MAVSLLAYEVSDLCIGKPPSLSLSSSSSLSAAFLSLKSCHVSSLPVWEEAEKTCLGKVSMADVVCFLCDEENLKCPKAALNCPVSAVLKEDSVGLVEHVERDFSMLEALDLILDGAQTLIVPIRSDGGEFCCLTPEDFARFFLNSIGVFYSVSTLSVDSLGIIQSDIPAINYHEPALSAVPMIKIAQSSDIAVAVVTDDGKLVGEIAPSAIGAGGEIMAAAIAALSAGELMAFLDCGGSSEKWMATVKARLQANAMIGMLDLIDEDFPSEDEFFAQVSLPSQSSLSSSSSPLSPLSSSPSSPSSSSSSDEESTPKIRRRGKKQGGSGRRSTRKRGQSDEAVVAHPGSSLMAVLIQALAHRVNYVWVVGDDFELVGVVTLAGILRIFRELL